MLAKLEQQAQRATARLEQKMNETQVKLKASFEENLINAATKEKQSLENASTLRTVLSKRLSAAGEELQGKLQEGSESGCQKIKDSSSTALNGINELAASLSQEVLQTFDQLGQSTTGLSSAHNEKAEAQLAIRLSAIKEAVKALQEKLEKIGQRHGTLMQEQYELLARRLAEIDQQSESELNATLERLVSELVAHKLDCMKRLDSLADELADTLKESMKVCGLNIVLHADVVGSNQLIPKLVHCKQEIAIGAQKFREKYKEEVEKAANMKLGELRPMLASSREKLEATAKTAQELKASIEMGQKEAFEKMLLSLNEFVEAKLGEARNLAELSGQEFSEIEKSVSALSDASSIESDPEMAAVRTQVIRKLKDIGSQLQEQVNDSLRKQVADMEDKGRILQEELISSMEGDAYAVRKSVESSINKIKQSMEQAHNKIASLQNQYLQ